MSNQLNLYNFNNLIFYYIFTIIVTQFVDREEGGGTGEHSKDFNNKINKHKIKAAAPHGRLPHTKHKLNSRPGPLSFCTVVTFILPKLLRGTQER